MNLTIRQMLDKTFERLSECPTLERIPLSVVLKGTCREMYPFMEFAIETHGTMYTFSRDDWQLELKRFEEGEPLRDDVVIYDGLTPSWELVGDEDPVDPSVRAAEEAEEALSDNDKMERVIQQLTDLRDDQSDPVILTDLYNIIDRSKGVQKNMSRNKYVRIENDEAIVITDCGLEIQFHPDEARDLVKELQAAIIEFG